MSSVSKGVRGGGENVKGEILESLLLDREAGMEGREVGLACDRFDALETIQCRGGVDVKFARCDGRFCAGADRKAL